jgi:hypothetical protein
MADADSDSDNVANLGGRDIAAIKRGGPCSVSKLNNNKCTGFNTCLRRNDTNSKTTFE